MAILKWVQISDLHLYYRNFDTSLHRYSLIDKLKELCFDGIDFLLVTGDIGYKGIFDTAGTVFFKELIAAVNCPPKQIFIVPGNHDLKRSEPRDVAIQNARNNFEQVDEDDWDFLSHYCFKKFARIYEDVTGKVYSEKESDVCHIEKLEGHPINIIHINTSAIAGRDDDSGNLRICNSRLVEILQGINKDYINIAIGHHGLDFLHPDDKIRLLQSFNQYKVLVYLCGHNHQLGEDVFGNLQKGFLLRQLTCGGLIQDDYNESSFVFGTINTKESEIHADLYQYIKSEWKNISEFNCVPQAKESRDKPAIISDRNYNNWLDYFIKYFKRVQDYGETFSFLQISDKIFANIECSHMKVCEADDAVIPMLSCIYDSWRLPTRQNIIVIGEGGMGKTVSLLEVWEALLTKNSIFCIYIPLCEINESETWLTDFLRENIFFNNASSTEEFLNHVDRIEDGRQPSFVLLLDGFNEINRGRQINVIRTIRSLKKYTSYQVVMTSRFDAGLTYGLNNYITASVKPLNGKQIHCYLKECGAYVDSKRRFLDVFKVPLMLTLFTCTARLYSKYLSAPQIRWIKSASTKGAIIYNYIQCQIAKQLDQLCTPDKTFMTTMAINYILPYIGWKMEKEGIYFADESCVGSIFDSANDSYRYMCAEVVPPIILADKRHCGASNLDWDKDQMWELINNEFHFFTRYNNKLSLIHQDFRDCLAAIHLVNDLYFFDTPQSWDEKVISDDVMQYIVETFRTRFGLKTVYQKIELLRDKDLSNRYILINFINLIAKVQYGDLSTVDFSRLDLRKLRLSSYTFVKGERTANFLKAKLSEITFVQDYHKAMITSVAYSYNGDYYAIAANNLTVRIWDAKTNLCIYMCRVVCQTIKVLFSRDNSLLICVGIDKHVRVWNWKTNTIKDLGCHGQRITDIKCSFDGETCITASYDCSLHIWNINKSRMVRKVDVIGTPLSTVALSPQEETIFCGTKDGRIIVLKNNSYELLKELKCHEGVITGIAFSEDADTFATTDNFGKIKIWDTSEFRLIKESEGCGEKISQIAYCSYIGAYITLSPKQSTMFWDSKTGDLEFSISDAESNISCFACSPEGKEVLQATMDGLLKIWGITSRDYIYKQHRNITNGIRCISVTKDKKYCLAAMEDNTVEKWDIKTGKIVREYFGHPDVVNSIQCAKNSNTFITACGDSLIRVWNIDTGKCEAKLQGHTKSVNKVCFLEDETLCASVSEDKTIRFWNIFDGKELKCEIASRAFTDIAVSSELIIGSALDNKLRGWSIPKFWRVFTRKIYLEGVHAVAVSPLKRQFASLHGNKIYIWNYNSDEPIAAVESDKGIIKCIAFSPNGNKLIAGCASGVICAWNIDDFKCRFFSDNHRMTVTDITFLADDEFITSSEDGTWKIWSIENNSCLSTISMPTFNLSGCNFSEATFETSSTKAYVIECGGSV